MNEVKADRENLDFGVLDAPKKVGKSSFFDATLEKKNKLNDNTFEFLFKVPPEFVFKPGQYVWVVLKSLAYPDPRGQRRAFTISSSSENSGIIGIIFRASESGFKKSLVELSEGSVVGLRGPMGSAFTVDESIGDNLVFIGGGVAIAPAISIMRSYSSLDYKPHITLVNVQPSKKACFLLDELGMSATNSNITIINQLDSVSLDFIKEFSDVNDATYFVAGRQKRVDEVFNKLKAKGVVNERIRFEEHYPEIKNKEIRELLNIDNDEKDMYDSEGIDLWLSRRFFIYFSSFTAIFMYALFVYFVLVGFQMKDVFIVFLTGFLVSLNMIIFYFMNKFFIAINILLAIIVGVATWSLSVGLINGHIIAWLYFFPILPMFLLGKKSGIAWVVLYVIAIYAAYVLNGSFGTDYILQSILSIIFSGCLGATINFSKSNLLKKLYHSLSVGNSFRLAVESSINHVIITDPNGLIVFGNKVAQESTGYRFSEMKMQTPRLWGGVMGKDFYREFWTKKKMGEQAFTGEILNVRKNGEEYASIAHISPIFNKAKELIGYVGTEEDITERLYLEKKLKEDEENLEEAQRIGQFGSFIWNLKTDKATWSNEAFYIHGLEPTLSKVPPSMDAYFDSIFEEDREGARRSMENALKTTEENQYVYRVKWKDNSVHFIRANTRLLMDDQKQLNILKGTFQDVTKEQQIDKAKSEFISLASHQLRTPLSTINWYCEMLLAGDAGQITDEQKKFIEEAYIGSRRMTKLVGALLNVSRIDAGTYMVQPEMTDVLKLIRYVLDENKPESDAKGVQIKLNQEEIPQIMLDPNLTTIILQNLIGNAIKYSREEGMVDVDVKIVKSGQQVEDRVSLVDSLLISVKDHGIGIPASQQDQVFKKLFRADNVRQANTDGNGLGLYLVKALVEHSKGNIWFVSKENEETIFYVLLPLSGMIKREGIKKIDQ